MYRFTVALALLVASASASWAQGFSLWRSQNGALLKVWNIDAATGHFSGIFISNPTGPCPAVPYELTGRVGPDHQVIFQTSNTRSSDCAVTAVWAGRGVSAGTVAARWVASHVASDGHVVRTQGTEIFERASGAGR